MNQLIRKALYCNSCDKETWNLDYIKILKCFYCGGVDTFEKEVEVF